MEPMNQRTSFSIPSRMRTILSEEMSVKSIRRELLNLSYKYSLTEKPERVKRIWKQNESGAFGDAALTPEKAPPAWSAPQTYCNLITHSCQGKKVTAADFEEESRNLCAPPGTRTRISSGVSGALCPFKLARLTSYIPI